MPLISAALYLAQFVSPFILSAVSIVFGGIREPYYLAIAVSAAFLALSFAEGRQTEAAE